MRNLFVATAWSACCVPALVLGATTASQAATESVVRASASAPATQPLANDLDRVSYSLGMKLARNVRKDLPDVNPEALCRGIRDLLGGEPVLTEDQASDVLSKYSDRMRARQDQRLQDPAEFSRREGAEFLARNARKPGVKVTPTGLQYKILQQGDGPIPKAGDIVSVRYRGTFIDGSEFDSSHGKPASFRVNGVIPGWTEALEMMPVGSKWQLFIPAALAYGERGADPLIGQNVMLIFEVELVAIRISEGAGTASEPGALHK